MAKESNKERALTLEAIRVLDAIDRRGSFAAAADELGKVPSALSYTVQKLEDELDAMLFDRSGHRTKFTPAGRMLLERGRVLLEAAEHLVGETRALARGEAGFYLGVLHNELIAQPLERILDPRPEPPRYLVELVEVLAR